MIGIRFMYYYFFFNFSFSIWLFCVPNLVWDFSQATWYWDVNKVSINLFIYWFEVIQNYRYLRAVLVT